MRRGHLYLSSPVFKGSCPDNIWGFSSIIFLAFNALFYPLCGLFFLLSLFFNVLLGKKHLSWKQLNQLVQTSLQVLLVDVLFQTFVSLQTAIMVFLPLTCAVVIISCVYGRPRLPPLPTKGELAAATLHTLHTVRGSSIRHRQNALWSLQYYSGVILLFRQISYYSRLHDHHPHYICLHVDAWARSFKAYRYSRYQNY